MKIAVIGGAGFVGSHLCESLVRNGHDVVIVDNFFTGKNSNIHDLTSRNMVKVYREDATQCLLLHTILTKEKIEAVYNLAMKCLPTSFLDPEGAYMIGVQIAHNLAYLLREKTYSKLIHFSSSEAYGTAQTIPMDENHPTNPTVPYSAGKLAADLLLMSYYRTFDLDIGIVRPFNLIGPRQNWQLYAAVVPLTIKRIMDGKKPFITGDGLQTRDFTYVTDVTEKVASLVADAEFSKLRGKIVNFGQGKETTIVSIVKAICKAMDYPENLINYIDERPADVRRHYADISLAKQLFNYTPKTPLDKGIEQTVYWFQKLHRAKR